MGCYGKVQLGVAVNSPIRVLGCTAKCGTIPLGGITPRIRYYLNNVNNVTAARSMI